MASKPNATRRGITKTGFGDQGLDFHQQGPRSLQTANNHRARRLLRPLREKKPGWIDDRRQPFAGHLEHPQLAGGPVPILGRPDHSVGMITLAFEIQNRVHNVLERFGPGEIAILGHVSYEENRSAGGFGEIKKLRRHLTNLADTPRGGREPGRVDGLRRIEHHQCRILAFERFENPIQVRFGEKKKRWRFDPESLPAKLYLPFRLLSADVNHRGRPLGHIRRHLKQQSRLPDPGISPEKNQRARNHPSPENAIELVDSRPDAHRVIGAHLAIGTRPPSGG